MMRRDFAEFLENPNREWDYVADELVEEKEELETGITFFLRDNLYGREQLAQIQGALAAVKASEKELDLGSLELKRKTCRRRIGRTTGRNISSPSLSAKKS